MDYVMVPVFAGPCSSGVVRRTFSRQAMVALGTSCWLLLLLATSARAQISDGLHQQDLSAFLQPDNVGDNTAAPAQSSASRCDRECVVGGKPKLCYYHFTVEDYHVLGAACGRCPLIKSDCYLPQCVTADGYERGLLTVNRRLPGPSIQVCVGDRVIVDVLNVMPGRTTTVHFHGIFQQRSNTMDGVPMVTQCPIPEGATFRYDFFAANHGTHFWHSHDGLQKMDGLLGTLIVRAPRPMDPSSSYYDDDLHEHNLMVVDWFEVDADQKLPGLRSRHPGQEPVSFLANGRGRLLSVSETHNRDAPIVMHRMRRHLDSSSPASSYKSMLLSVVYHHPETTTTPPFFRSRFGSHQTLGRATPDVPLSVFVVQFGRRYRFRTVGGTCAHCPVELSIERHQLRVIATDGNAVRPVYVDRIVLLPGERYDFVVEARQPRTAYWIHMRGLGPCTAARTYGLAVLQYEGSPTTEPSSPDPGYSGPETFGTVTLNPVSAKCGPLDDNVCVTQLQLDESFDARLRLPTPDRKLVFEFDFKDYTQQELFRTGTYHRFLQRSFKDVFCGVINRVQNKSPSTSILNKMPDLLLKHFCQQHVASTKPQTPLLVAGFINRISNTLGASPLLTQIGDIPPELFCPPGGCSTDFCECLHLVKVPLNAVVEMVLADTALLPGDLTHPFHLHGHKFHVMELGQFAAGRRKLGLLRTNNAELDRAQRRWVVGNATAYSLRQLRQGQGWYPAKDTVAVPAAGYAIVRFLADNPGYWMVHCHFIYHQTVGMSLILQVGEPNEFPARPPGFPTCGNYAPWVDVSAYV